MIFVQLLLLKVALDNRPAPGIKGGIEHAPFSEHEDSGRPYNFWKWKNTKPYVHCDLLWQNDGFRFVVT